MKTGVNARVSTQELTDYPIQTYSGHLAYEVDTSGHVVM
jgi:hypothetical protein